ncbi:MAG: TetR family transcriptional regulator [Roseiarcus sp.]|jgi:AcrR family transcriptional regulator
MTARLGKREWIDAGLHALSEDGVEAVRVERLAAMLHVTKGSFYWHFKDRRTLLEAMLETWRSRATNAIIDEVEAKGGGAIARLRTLSTIVSRIDGRLDRAIRVWAGQDEMARAALDEIDRRRLDYLASLFAELSFAPREAVARARLVYHALIGQFAMGERGGRAERLAEHLDVVIPMLVRK